MSCVCIRLSLRTCKPCVLPPLPKGLKSFMIPLSWVILCLFKSLNFLSLTTSSWTAFSSPPLFIPPKKLDCEACALFKRLWTLLWSLATFKRALPAPKKVVGSWSWLNTERFLRALVCLVFLRSSDWSPPTSAIGELPNLVIVTPAPPNINCRDSGTLPP